MIDTTKPISAVKYNGQELPMQGAVITDGVVVKSRDADGNPTEIDFYGSALATYQFGFNGYGNRCNPFSLVSKINFKNAINSIGSCAFQRAENFEGDDGTVSFPQAIITDTSFLFEHCSRIKHISLPLVTTCRNHMFAYCSSLLSIDMPSCNLVWSGGEHAFKNCSALQSITLGSVGHAVNINDDQSFNTLTQAGLKITVYVGGAVVDTTLSRIRNGATKATIVIKASEDTTYNGTAYSAGDTIITSTVEATES